MTSLIATHEATYAAQERLVQILHEQYNTELATLFATDGDYLTPAGLYLPPVTRWYRQPEPSRETMPNAQEPVCGYIGMIGPTGRANWTGLVGSSFVSKAQIPFGAGVYFLMSAHGVTDAVQGGALGPEEVMLQRAYCYLGALRHTLVKYGCRHPAVQDVTPNADMGLGGSISSREGSGEDMSMMGIVMLELLVSQEETFPAQTTLP